MDGHQASPSRVSHLVARRARCQLARLDEFAVDRRGVADTSVRALGAAELTRMMDANFARAQGSRRAVDRRLMEGEWPVLLRIIGTRHPDGDFLAVSEVSTMFADRRLPDRIAERLGAADQG